MSALPGQMIRQEHVSIVTCGQVDSGKCTTTGRLLFEVDGIPERKLDKLTQEAERLEISSSTINELTTTEITFCLDIKDVEELDILTYDMSIGTFDVSLIMTVDDISDKEPTTDKGEHESPICDKYYKFKRSKRTPMPGEKTKNMRRLGMLNTRKKQRTPILKCPSSRKNIKKSLTQKKAAAKKEHEVHDTRNNAKDQVERENAAAAAEAESTLVEAVAQEIERRSMKSSSKVANQRCGTAQHEHRRHRGSDDGKKGSERDRMTGERLQNQRPHPPVRIEDEEDAHEIDAGNGCSCGCDLRAGERLPKQRPLGDEHPEHNSEEHLGAQVPHQVEEAGSIVFHSSSNASEFKNDNKEAQVTTSAAATESEEFLDKDADILRLIEEREACPKKRNND